MISSYGQVAMPRRNTEDLKLEIETLHPKFVAAWKDEGAQEGAKAENARERGIRAMARAGDEEIVARCIKDLDCSVEAAALRLGKAETARQEARQAARNGLAKSVVPQTPLADAEADSNRALARSIVARARRAEDSKVLIE